MTKPIIAIDIDDVLADNAAGFVAFSNERWGTTLRPEDYDEHWAKLWQVDNKEIERRANEFHESKTFVHYTHRDEALPVLKKLSVMYDLIIVTSRRMQVRADTTAWVHKHYPGIFSDEDIHFAGIWDTIDDTSIHRTKADVIEALGASYLIDDQLKHCIAVADAGSKAILFGDYTWNQSDELPKNVTRLNDWHAVEVYFSNEAGR